jgi:lysine-specific demethylase 8
VNAWLGPGGTTTPLHTDPQHNLLCQVLGRKYVRLYGPECGPALRPCESGLTTNSSRLELDDAADAAAASALPFLEGVLSPGASLFIPPGWWHYVRSLSPSISVSFWWS